ncbi:MAG: hypothetical protein WC676_00975 [Candidatus Omnitrophota bacterium]
MKIKNSACLGLAIIFVFAGGCASAHKTTTTETTVTTYPAVSQEQKDFSNKGYITRQQDESVSQESETTTTITTTDTETERPGVISSTFHAIGYVLAIPFIIIGGLFKMIFGG